MATNANFPKVITVPCTLEEYTTFRLRAANEGKAMAVIARGILFPEGPKAKSVPIKRSKETVDAETPEHDYRKTFNPGVGKRKNGQRD